MQVDSPNDDEDATNFTVTLGPDGESAYKIIKPIDKDLETNLAYGHKFSFRD